MSSSHHSEPRKSEAVQASGGTVLIMTARSAFKQAEINAVAQWAKAGVRLAMVVKPDGTKIIMAASDSEAPTASNDLDARLDAYGGM